jgi:hypothetical protein
MGRMGDWGKRRCSSPGFVDDRGRALKGRPNENRVCPSFRQPRILKVVRRSSSRLARMTRRSPLQGDLFWSQPRAEALGCSV